MALRRIQQTLILRVLAPQPDSIACAIGNGEGRSIAIEAPGDLAFEVREGLIEQGLPTSLLESHRNQDLSGVVIHVHLVQ